MEKSEISYCAGFFDGEGWVRFAKIPQTSKWSKSPAYALQVGINNCNPFIVDYFYKTFGGNFYHYKRKKEEHRDIYTWMAFTAKAAAFLLEVLPYLIVKKDEVGLALHLYLRIQEQKGMWQKGRPVSAEELAYRESVIKKISDLKHQDFMFNHENSENSVDTQTDDAVGNTEPSLLS